MKKPALLMLSSVLIFALSSFAQAALVNVPVANSDFTDTSTQWISSTEYLGNQVWYYTSGNWKDTGSTHFAAFGKNNGKGTVTGDLLQVVQFEGGIGSGALSFNTKYNLSLYDNVTVYIYGSQSAIASGTTNAPSSAFGDLLTSYSFTGSGDYWTNPVTLSFFAAKNYSNYTLLVDSKSTIGSSYYFNLDNIKLTVSERSSVPIPSAAFLLTSGLIGMISVIRKKAI